MTGRLPFAALMAGLLVAAGCTGDSTPHPENTYRDTVVPAGAVQLVAYSSCEDALRRLKEAAKEHVGPYGLAGEGARALGAPGAAEGGAVEDRAAAGAPVPNAAAAPNAAPKAEAPAHSGTNTHEAGVDEPDLVKTDGRRIVTVSRGVLQVVDPQTKQVTGKLDLNGSNQDIGAAADLLLSGDHALVLTRDRYADRGGPIAEPAPKPANPADPGEIAGPRLILVDLSGEPRVLSSYTVDGSLVDARQVGATARVVVRSAPRLYFPYTERSSDGKRLARNKEIIDRAGLDDMLPRYAVTTDGKTEQGLVECAAVSRPAKYTGSSMLTVLSFDLGAEKLGKGDPVTVVADGNTVYSNGSSLYVASDQRWRGTRQRDEVTEVYKFDISGTGRPRYVAAGSVPGWLINQYALSEWDGHLRVATTRTASNDSAVYVLRQDGKELARTGTVGGLGKDERIYAVRFVGPTGYVVTFRQTDPLYTVDLSDPAKPKVTGELKITGYSAYLHPAGEGRLIGVGQEATTQGQRLGTQVSLFDVSDLNRPDRLAQYHVEQASSEAEIDPHAFLYWPAERLLVIPLNTSGALVLRVDDHALTEVGTVTQQAGEQIRRSLVIGGELWTVSETGLQATSLSTMDRTAWVALT